jgi:hypothetical protein
MLADLAAGGIGLLLLLGPQHGEQFLQAPGKGCVSEGIGFGHVPPI